MAWDYWCGGCTDKCCAAIAEDWRARESDSGSTRGPCDGDGSPGPYSHDIYGGDTNLKCSEVIVSAIALGIDIRIEAY